MRSPIVGILILIMLTTFLTNAPSADPPPPPPQFAGAYPVDLKIGELFIISKSIEIVSPVRFPICDDLKVVDVVDTTDGMAFKGIAPGKTLCSVSGGVGPRRVFAITVHQE